MSSVYDKIEYLKTNIKNIKKFLQLDNIKNLSDPEKKEQVYKKFDLFCNTYSHIANKILENDMNEINNFLSENKIDLSEPTIIRKKVIEIQNYLKKPHIKKLKNDKIKHELAVRNHFPIFENKYPFLLKRIVNEHNLDFLEDMLIGLKKIKKGDTTLEKVEMNLGNKLFKDFKPKTN